MGSFFVDKLLERGKQYDLTILTECRATELILEEGDSIYFNPLYPHGQVCADDKPAVFLTVIAE